MDFAEKLTQLRKSGKMSQEDLAELLGVSRQAVSRWEQGSTFPDIPNLQRIMEVFCVSADYLIGDTQVKGTHSFEESEEDVSRPIQKLKRNRFLVIGMIWLLAAVCFLIAAIDSMQILYVILTLVDVALACVNFFLHFHRK